MAYFPFFVDIEGKSALIVGGGRVAARKIEKLLPYGPSITVAAPYIDGRICAIPGLELIEAPFSPEMLEGRSFVIAATNDGELNGRVSRLCAQRGIPVNVVDDRELCSFLFPALVKRGAMSVGISTGGASPSAAIWLKERVEELLPPELPELLDWLESVRPDMKRRIPDERERAEAFRRLFEQCMETGRVPPGEEYGELTEARP